MPWLTAALLAAGLVLAVTAAGGAVLVAAGPRGRRAASAAPAVGTGVVALAAVAGTAAGTPWGLLPVALVTAACAGAAALAALPGRRARTADAPATTARARDRVLAAAAVTAGSVLLVVPTAVAAGRPDRVQNAWDALFHLAALDLLRAGDAVDVRAVSELAAPGRDVSYPFAWHAVAALTPRGVDPVTAANVAALVPVVVLGVAGTVALARVLFPARPHVAPVAAVLTAAAVGAPLAIAVQPGLVPYAYGLALVPGTLAWLLRLGRPTAADLVPAALAAAGICLSHPSALVTLLLIAAPWAVVSAVRWQRAAGARTPTGQRRLLVLVAAGGAVLAAPGLAMALSSTGTAVATTAARTQDPVPAGELARRLLTGDLGQWPVAGVAVVVLAVTGAVVLVRRREQRALVAAAALAVVAYAAAVSPWPAVSSLTAFWYTETRRVAPLVGLAAALLAARGVVAVAGWVRARARRRLAARGATVVAVACGVALVAAGVVPGVRAVHGTAADTFAQDVPDDPSPMTRVPYLTADEERMVARLAGRLGPGDVLLGSSFSGAGHLAVLSGARAVLPYHMTPHGPDVTTVSRRLADLGTDPAVCAAVRRLGATHVYVDPHPLHSTYWTTAYPATFTATPGPAARLVDAGGTASVHSLEACHPAG